MEETTTPKIPSQINLAPMCQEWERVIEQAYKAREPFMETARICNHFFCGAADFMWTGEFHNRYLGGVTPPTFKCVIAKGFEYVSIVGPGLFWDYPARVVADYPPLEVLPEVFGDPNDPMAQQAYQQFAMQYEIDRNINSTRRAFMERYLNESQKIQPGGGLAFDSQLAIIEAIVKGRGCLRVDTYIPEGESSPLTGAFYMSVDDLLIDADCRMANLRDAKWISIRHIEPRRDVEQKFGLPEGSLNNYANAESQTSAAVKSSADDWVWRRIGGTNDLIVWYEIFSKCGAGTRLRAEKQVMPEWHQAFEKACGNYARLCLVKGMPEFLNCSNKFLENATLDEVRAALDWPVPYYRLSNRWPVAMLDFWCSPNSPWPIATLSQGLGELVFLNLLVSCLMDRVYKGSLTKMAIKQELVEEAVEKLRSYKSEVIGLNGAVGQNINELVSWLEQPNVSYELFQVLEYVSQMFNRRVGLMDIMYGENPGGKVDRSAAATNVKSEAVAVRPEWMSRQVEGWQSVVAQMECLAAGWNVTSESSVIKGLFGEYGAPLWDKLIAQEDPNVYVRDMRCSIEANSSRRPNRAKDNDNLKNIAQYALPAWMTYFQMTGDPSPVNGFMQQFGKAIEQDVSGMMMQPPPPPQPEEPELTPEEQMLQQLQIEKGQQDLQKGEMGMAKGQLDMVRGQMDLAHKRLQMEQIQHNMMMEGAARPADELAGIVPAGEDD